MSTFRTLTLSVPIPRISFGCIFVPTKLPDTEKYVTKPVTEVLPTAILVPMPLPTSLNVSLETPIKWEPSRFVEILDTPVILTKSKWLNVCGVSTST